MQLQRSPHVPPASAETARQNIRRHYRYAWRHRHCPRHQPSQTRRYRVHRPGLLLRRWMRREDKCVPAASAMSSKDVNVDCLWIPRLGASSTLTSQCSLHGIAAHGGKHQPRAPGRAEAAAHKQLGRVPRWLKPRRCAPAVHLCASATTHCFKYRYYTE